jgi:prepilin-type processing-associated H-X9-DG protein
MKTYEIKIKAGAGSFHKMGQESYSSLEAAMVDLKDIETVFKPHAVFLFCDGHIACKTGIENGELRDPFHSMGDGFHSLAVVASGLNDPHLVSLMERVALSIKEINDHLDSNYLWD